MGRQDFDSLLCCFGWPFLARSVRAGAPHVVGLLCSDPAELRDPRIRVFKQALREAGCVEGRNVAFENRFDEHLETLPAIAADLVRRQVALIFATPTPPAKAAKAATQSIPIIFSVGVGPVARKSPPKWRSRSWPTT